MRFDVRGLMCCLKGRGEVKGGVGGGGGVHCIYRLSKIVSVRLSISKTEARVGATCISSSDELHQIYYKKLVLGLLLGRVTV
jgi:hypothetical protein